MKKSRYSESQIMKILKQGEAGAPVPELCREHGMSSASFYRYNRTVRYDWLSQYIFKSINQVQEHVIRWLWTYNNDRPNMAIGGITPIQKLALAA